MEMDIKEETLDQDMEAVTLDPEEELVQKEDVWECKLCFKACKQYSTARDHILAHLAIPGGLTCLQCGLNFTSRDLFIVHMTSEHKSFKRW